MMKIKEAIELLKEYNYWRRYDGEVSESPKMPNPKEIGIAIDLVISKFEDLFISGVSNCNGVKGSDFEDWLKKQHLTEVVTKEYKWREFVLAKYNEYL